MQLELLSWCEGRIWYFFLCGLQELVEVKTWPTSQATEVKTFPPSSRRRRGKRTAGRPDPAPGSAGRNAGGSTIWTATAPWTRRRARKSFASVEGTGYISALTSDLYRTLHVSVCLQLRGRVCRVRQRVRTRNWAGVQQQRLRQQQQRQASLLLEEQEATETSAELPKEAETEVVLRRWRGDGWWCGGGWDRCLTLLSSNVYTHRVKTRAPIFFSLSEKTKRSSFSSGWILRIIFICKMPKEWVKMFLLF